jgi:YD repeat-containing protein
MTSNLFSYELFYNSSPSTAGTPQKNGNIAEIKWQVQGGDEMAFGYKYDNYNRLINSYSKNITQNKTNEYQTIYQHDVRGNITALSRRGMYANGSTFAAGLIDNLAILLQSGSNKINTVTDNASITLKHLGAKGSAASYVYDNDNGQSGNGNLTFDASNGAQMLYNHLNLPRLVTMPDGEIIEFTYDADGNQLRKQAKQGGVTTEDRHYIGDAEYKDGKLVQVMHSQGRVVRETSCDQNQNISGLLNTTGPYQGDHIFSDATIAPTGNTIYMADKAIILNEHFAVETGKEFHIL